MQLTTQNPYPFLGIILAENSTRFLKICDLFLGILSRNFLKMGEKSKTGPMLREFSAQNHTVFRACFKKSDPFEWHIPVYLVSTPVGYMPLICMSPVEMDIKLGDLIAAHKHV